MCVLLVESTVLLCEMLRICQVSNTKMHRTSYCSIVDHLIEVGHVRVIDVEIIGWFLLGLILARSIQGLYFDARPLVELQFFLN